MPQPNEGIRKGGGTHTRDMTVGNPYTLMVSFALPLFLSQVFQQLYNTADALIVGRFLGTEALAAVTSSGTLIHLLVSFFMGTAMGAGVVISRYFGAGDYGQVSRGIHTVLAFGVASGLFLTAAGVAFTPTFLRWMQTDPEVMPDAVEYFRYYFMGSLALVLYNICRSIMNALGNSRRPLYYLIFSSLVNVVLDVLFIGVFHWGVWAAAFATVLSQVASVVLCMAHLMRRGTVFTVELKKIRFHRDLLAEIIRYGLPSGVQNSLIGFANVMVQTNINAFGDSAMAGCGSYSKIEGFPFLPVTCFSMGLATFVSQNLGARQHDRVKQGARFGVLCSVVTAEVIGVAIWLGAPFFIALFNNDPEVVAFGVRQARVESLFYCLLALNHCIAGVLRGAGKATVPMVIMMVCWCVIRVVYITAAVGIWRNILVIFTAYPLTWSLSAVAFLIYYFKADWLHTFDRLDARQQG